MNQKLNTDTTPPSVPTGLSNIKVTSSAATITWNALTDKVEVSTHRLLRNGAQAITYSYTVQALDAAGNVSAANSPQSVTTLAGPVGRQMKLTIANTTTVSGWAFHIETM